MKTTLRSLPVIVLALLLVRCHPAPSITAIQIIPAGATLTVFDQTAQFKAFGLFARSAGRGVFTQEITNQVNWTSSSTAVASINATGLATAAINGTTTITASIGGVAATAILLVDTSGQAAHDLIAMTVIPITQTVTTVGEPAQFIAIGSFNSNPTTEDLTNQVTWESSDVSVATINSAGLALANACAAPAPCTTTITAIGMSNSGASIPGSATLTFNNTGGGVVLPQLTVYEVGLGSGTVASSPAGINCTSGAAPGAGCTGNFVLNSTVTLTATPSNGSSFGGWSANCVPDTATTCKIVMSNNEPVGAIFNSN